MFDLTLENAAGDQLTFAMGSPFTIVDIQGLNPPTATINTSQVALMDGAKFNNSKLNMRTINVAFAIEYNAAANRIEVFKVLKSKQYVKMLYVSDVRDVFIEGYIESIDITYFDMKQIVTCSIICPSPYLKAAQEVVDELSNIINSFHFPFASPAEGTLVFGYISNDLGITIENDGDCECGMIIELYANAAVSNPKIFNYITQDYIGLTYDMQPHDLITIDTRQGQKTAMLLRNGVQSNVFNAVMKNSAWLQLPANGGTFVYEVGTGSLADLTVTFKHYNLFEGV